MAPKKDFYGTSEKIKSKIKRCHTITLSLSMTKVLYPLGSNNFLGFTMVASIHRWGN